MTYAVRYYTKTGNTKRLAEAIAAELGVKALPISEPVTEKVDYLFLGNSYYAFNIDPEVKDFVSSLDRNLIGKIVKKTYKLYAEDSENTCNVGDTVRVMETRPLSKMKRWRLVEVIERAK